MTGRLEIIGAPSSAGAYAPGQERAPEAIRAAGLLSSLGSPAGAPGALVVLETDDDVVTDPRHEVRRDGRRVRVTADPQAGPLMIGRVRS